MFICYKLLSLKLYSISHIRREKRHHGAFNFADAHIAKQVSGKESKIKESARRQCIIKIPTLFGKLNKLAQRNKKRVKLAKI